MNSVFVHHAPGLRTTRLVRQLVVLGFVIGMITLLSFLWYFYQMHQAKFQLQNYQDHYAQIFTSFNLTLSEAQHEIRDLIHLPIDEIPRESTSWSKPLIEVSLALAGTQKADKAEKGYQLEQTITKLLDLRQCMVSTHLQMRELHFASQFQYQKIMTATRHMQELAEIHHGEHRLFHAQLVRQYLDHPREQTLEKSRTIIDHMRDILKSQTANTEFSKLTNVLEQLNKSTDKAQIADLKDNRIAVLIQRLHQEPACGLHAGWREDYFQQLHAVEQMLYGITMTTENQLKTNSYTQDSFIDACYKRAEFVQQLDDVYKQIEQNINQLLRAQTDIALQTRVSANEVWADFQLAGQRNFIQTSIILSTCWSIFFFLGVMIHKQVRQQIRQQQETQEKLHKLIEQHEKDQQATQHLHQKLIQAHKLESVGQLAAGIAMEINSPSQYVSDNSEFLKGAFDSLKQINQLNGKLLTEARSTPQMQPFVQAIDTAIQKLDAQFLWDEIPSAIEQSIDGIHRVSEIVESMCQFAQPSRSEKIPYDLNKAVRNVLMISRNTWKYVARIDTQFNEYLPLIDAFPSEVNQALLNILVNATQAISDKQKVSTLHEGIITIKTMTEDNQVVVHISDNGVGIAPEIRDRIFDPFFSTRPHGQGAGQGLALAYNSIVEMHQGCIEVATEVGEGTTFSIMLPMYQDADSSDSPTTRTATNSKKHG